MMEVWVEAGWRRSGAAASLLREAHLAGLGLSSLLLGKEKISPERKLLATPQPPGPEFHGRRHSFLSA